MHADPYARIAAVYDAEFNAADTDVLGYERPRVGNRVLVLGCGTGRVSRGLGAPEVVGLDRSEPMLDRARQRAGPQDLARVAGISREIAQRIYDWFHSGD